LVSNQQLDCLWLPEIQKPAQTRLGLPSHSNWVVTKQKWDSERESCTEFLVKLKVDLPLKTNNGWWHGHSNQHNSQHMAKLAAQI